jgi:hypothetical protein
MRKLTLLAAIAVAVAVAGTAVAAFPQDNVKLYTGCLNSGGTLTYVAEGENPLQACSSPKQVVKLSGGDITSVNTPAGSGLSGGNTNGAITLSLDAAHSLPAGCTNGQVPKSTGSNAWNCGTDNDHTYTADGTTLGLSGNTFSIASGYRVKNNQSCDGGKFASAIDSTGGLTCTAPSASGGVHGYFATTNHFALGGTMIVLSNNVPAGKYIVHAEVSFVNEDDNSESRGYCDIVTANDDIALDPVTVDEQPNIGAKGWTMASGGVEVTAGGAIDLKCTEADADIDVSGASMYALEVDALN